MPCQAACNDLLANRWQPKGHRFEPGILHFCCNRSTVYNEFNYLEQLRQRQSPLLAYVTTTDDPSLAK